MRIACVSDTHGMVPSLPLEGCDLLLHGGDFYNEIEKQDWRANNVGALKAWISKLSIPAWGVRGNHDCADPAGWFASSRDVTGSVQAIAADLPDPHSSKASPKLFVIGLGWHGERFFELPTITDMTRVCGDVLRQCMLKMKDGDQSVILTHFDAARVVYHGRAFPALEGWAYDCVRMVAEAVRPLAVMQGHSHRMGGEYDLHDGTLYWFPGQGGYLNIVDGNASIESGPLNPWSVP